MRLNSERYLNIAKIFYYSFKDYKLQIFILTIISFLGALMEGIGVNALIPLFSLITGEMGIGKDFISEMIAKIFSYFNVDFNFKYLLILICSLFIFKAIFLVLSEYIGARIMADYERNIRSSLFEKFINANWAYLLKQKLGHLEMVLMTNIPNAAAILSCISSFIIIFVSLFVYIFIAINISLYITLIALILSMVLFLVFTPFFYKMKMISYKNEAVNKEVSHHVNENILGMKTVKIMAVGQNVIEKGKEYFETFRNIRIRTSLLKVLTGSLNQPISLVFICIIFAFSYKTPGFNLAAFAAIMYLVKQIFSYIGAVQKQLMVLSSLIPYSEDVENHKKQVVENQESYKGLGKINFQNKLEFKKVEFFYNEGKKVLFDVNFEIKRGEMVGLVGSSGAGKSTIADLMLRLFKLNKGEITLDGIDIEKFDLGEWRKSIGYVSQDIFLMNDTIANNIKFYDDSITDEDIEEATKMANIYDFINNLPNKFSTVIGERGILLSGGQRQRIIIARILARKPNFLILDEATSALDNESEVQIQNVISNLKGKITVLAIAHRLSTLINSDRLLVIDKGRIIEQGKPQELLKDKETYFYKVYNIRK